MHVNPMAARDREAWDVFRNASESGLSVDVDDHGNWWHGELIGSNHGITAPVLEEWRGDLITADDMAALTIAEADDIADTQFWRPVGGDLLPSGVNLMLADFHWVGGSAVRMLQQALGFTGRDVDGIVGPMTLLAARGVKPANLIRDLHDRQAAYYVRLGQRRFTRGWINRDDRRRDLALKLATSP